MPEEKYLRLDDLAAPDGYATPSTIEDLAYIAYFRQTCRRYNIDFAVADQDERDFVIRMAEKNFARCTHGLDPYADPDGEKSVWKQWTG